MKALNEWQTEQSNFELTRQFISVLLISPKNEVLLLHRVQTSSSFPSAHVFPGGNLSPQDGDCLPLDDPRSHEDAPCYRQAAIRELFEESGIPLARSPFSEKLLVFGEDARESGRKAVHMNQLMFKDFLKSQDPNAEPDTDGLIPFTRWITPTTIPKRYSTQMYIYFLPLSEESDKKILNELPVEGKRDEIHVPTGDGGIEITEAMFLTASEWLQKEARKEIVLFPPQYLLLHLLSQFLDKEPSQHSIHNLRKRRSELVEFVHSGSPPWTEKYICPKLLKVMPDGRAVLALDHPGPELKDTDKMGETDRVVSVRFKKGIAEDLAVMRRKDVFKEGGKVKTNL